ncbi:hypothetical protein RRG08_047142 [Elysia crispata]|uniref:Uncharacterized protein n=1 Tax=Elysia crispata TaxID=231223 RepID=A0AAE1E1T9_9GAST|nr:hypothetical protein RRG08_047142 [Elysia crispata]
MLSATFQLRSSSLREGGSGKQRPSSPGRAMLLTHCRSSYLDLCLCLEQQTSIGHGRDSRMRPRNLTITNGMNWIPQSTIHAQTL